MLTLSELRRASRLLDAALRGQRLQAIAQPDATSVVLTSYGAPAEGAEPRRQHVLLACRRGPARVALLAGGRESLTSPPAFVQRLRALLPLARFRGVRPKRRAGRVTRSECERLAAAIREVLERSIETGGSSIRDYVSPDGSDGSYQDERRVYARTGEPCLRCGSRIRRTSVAQRGTHFCPTCQR